MTLYRFKDGEIGQDDKDFIMEFMDEVEKCPDCMCFTTTVELKMFDSLMKDIERLHSGNVAHQKTHLLGTLTWWKENLSHPTPISEEEIEDMVDNEIPFDEDEAIADEYNRYFFKRGIKAAIKKWAIIKGSQTAQSAQISEEEPYYLNLINLMTELLAEAWRKGEQKKIIKQTFVEWFISINHKLKEAVFNSKGAKPVSESKHYCECTEPPELNQNDKIITICGRCEKPIQTEIYMQ